MEHEAKSSVLTMRFPPTLRERIKESAQANHRSFNSEVMYRLEQSFPASAEKKSEAAA